MPESTRAYIDEILEEFKEEIPTEEKEEKVQYQEERVNTFSETEEKAISLGWKPKEDWIEEGNDPEDFVGPKAFLKLNKEKEKLASLESSIFEMNNKFQTLQETQEKEKEREIETQINNLKAARDSHLENGEILKAQKITDVIIKMESGYEQYKLDKQNKKDNTPNQVIRNKLAKFIENNTWMENKPENNKYTKRANLLYKQYTESYPDDSIDEALNYIKDEMENKFPELSKKQSKTKPINRVSGSSFTSSEIKSVKNEKDYDIFKDEEVDPYAKKMARYLEKKNVMSVKEYSKMYKDITKN